jgi:hypothetical protein
MTKSDAALEYEQRLTRVARRVLTKASAAVDFSPLARELGCRYVVDTPGEERTWHISGKSLPEAECEPKVRRTLLKAMHWQLARPVWHDSRGSSILSGLVQQERWRECLKSEDGAYAFAELIAHWSLAASNILLPLACVELRRAITIDVCAVLDAWLPQDAPWEGVPDTGRLLRLMFGEAWFSLVVNDGDLREKTLSSIVRGRPDFRPGLLPVQEARALPPLPLPALS